MAIQYTIRNIPPEVDKALKRKAKLTRKSFNQTVINELLKSTKKDVRGDFDWLFGSMKPDKAFDEAIADLSRVDEDWFNDPGHTRH